jgi:hypothetical protein
MRFSRCQGTACALRRSSSASDSFGPIRRLTNRPRFSEKKGEIGNPSPLARSSSIPTENQFHSIVKQGARARPLSHRCIALRAVAAKPEPSNLPAVQFLAKDVARLSHGTHD